VLFSKFDRHFGRDDDDVLVVRAPTREMNPTIDAELVDSALAEDPEAARAEWLAEWRADLEAFLSADLVEAALDRGRPAELPPQPDVAYRAFVDASGGRHDRYAWAIGHREGEAVVVDAVRWRTPPFDPAAVTAEVAAHMREYGVSLATGDRYGAQWTTEAFANNGCVLEASPKAKSDLYIEALPHFARGTIRLPPLREVALELQGLERRVSRTGRDSVDHAPGGRDDLANVVCGLAAQLAGAHEAWDPEKAFAVSRPLAASGFDTPWLSNPTPLAEIGNPATPINIRRGGASRHDVWANSPWGTGGTDGDL
jgi:hypothetical protein